MKIIFLVLLCLQYIYCKDELKHVYALYRHGDRAPTHLFSEDPNKMKMWPFGFGQLTDIGVRQQFQLGQWLRKRYTNFLKEKYDPKEIYITSTEVDRTMMSAQSNLAGLYYNENMNMVPGLNWRPIPVHLVSRITDTISNPNKCNKFKDKLLRMFKTEEYQSLYSEHKSTLDVLRKVSKDKSLRFEDAWYIFDSLNCERHHNITLDPWVTEELYEKITKMYEISWKSMYYGDELGRLSGGRFLDDIVNQMTDFAHNSNIRKDKFKMYSGHDLDVAAVLSAIGDYDGVRPPYASCILIELTHSPKNDLNMLNNWIVKVYYKDKSTDSPSDLPERKLAGCKSQPCTLGNFIDYVKPRTINLETYKGMCPTSSSASAQTNPLHSFVILMASLLIYSAV